MISEVADVEDHTSRDGVVLEVAIAGDWKEWVMRASFLDSFASDLTKLFSLHLELTISHAQGISLTRTYTQLLLKHYLNELIATEVCRKESRRA
jgi:hypothetical protein